nr:hypothetical protein [Tanacetum cinerariifolium]
MENGVLCAKGRENGSVVNEKKHVSAYDSAMENDRVIEGITSILNLDDSIKDRNNNGNGMDVGNMEKCATPITTIAPNIRFVSIIVHDPLPTDNSDPTHSEPTSYAKLVSGKPSRKSLNFRTLIMPAKTSEWLTPLLLTMLGTLRENMDRLNQCLNRLSVWMVCIQCMKMADVELKDTIMVTMPKLVGEGFYTCTIRVEYEWKPLRCACFKVFGHVQDEYLKNIGSDLAKNLKNPSQAPRGDLVVLSGNKKKDVEPRKEVSNLNLFNMLNSIENDVDLDDYLSWKKFGIQEFLRETQNLTGPNFIDWYRKLCFVLSTEDKENYLEHPILVAPVAPPRQQVSPQALAAHAPWVKGQKEELKAMYSKQAEQELLQTVREFHTSKQEEGQSVSSHVLKIKGYIDNLERLDQPVGKNLAVSLILVSLNKDIESFVQNYNMHGIGKTVNELHAMLKLHEETLPKKDANPALYVIRRRVQKNQKNKPHKVAKGGHGKCKGKMGYASNNATSASKPKPPPPPKKDNPAKDAIFHQCDEGLRGSKKLKPVSKNNLVYFMAVPRDGIYEIDMSYSNTNDSSMYAITNKRAKINLDSSLLWHCRRGHISKKRIEKLQHDGLLNSIDIKPLGKCVSCMSRKMARKPYSHQVERAKDLLGLIHTDEHGIIAHRIPPYTTQNNGVSERRNQTLLDMVRSMMSQTTLPKSFWDYALETAAPILNMVPTKKVDRTPYEIWHGQAPKLLLDLKASGSVEDLKLIQEEDTNPCVDTSLNHEEDDKEIEEPQSDINLIRKSSRTRRALDRMCLYINAEEHELGDLSEPANYKAALLDPESKKWLDAMNVEMQSMKDNDVWVLVELPPNARTVSSKWLFKKKTDMDGVIYVFKAPIAMYYDYEIWQMDVKTAFPNRHLSKEFYMEQLEGFVNPKYPNHVCKLKRSIYGLKQASRQWNKRFDDEIKKFGVTQNPDEPYVYLKANLGEAAYILGIKIYRDRSKRLIGLCQKAYIEKILKRFYMENSKRGTILMQENLKLSKSQGASTPAEKQRMQNIPYASAIGSIIGNMERKLRVSCYTDAGYLTDADSLKSQTGYVFVLNEGAVDWKSTKQSIFATSSTDAEYIAAFDASKKAV